MTAPFNGCCQMEVNMFTVEELARLIGEAERSLWGKTVHGQEERRKLIAEYIITKIQLKTETGN